MADQTFAVTVVASTGGNRYRFDGGSLDAETLELTEGKTYRFTQEDASNSGHPLRFSTTPDGTHGGGTEYTTGVTTAGTPGSSGAYTEITVAYKAPLLFYYCTNHSGMGGAAKTVGIEESDAGLAFGHYLTLRSPTTLGDFKFQNYWVGENADFNGTAFVAPIDVRYTVERINSVDYVTADQFQRGMRQAADQGATQGELRALSTLRQNTSQRRRIGL